MNVVNHNRPSSSDGRNMTISDALQDAMSRLKASELVVRLLFLFDRTTGLPIDETRSLYSPP